MKKLITTLSLIMTISFLALGCSADTGVTNPTDHYDSENYIGAADLSKDISEEMDITRAEMSHFTIKGDTAEMSGVIAKDTIRQVKKLIKDYPDVKTIHMISVDGSIDDESNLVACRLVREAGLNTYVSKDSHIASGGTDFFCSGVKRTAEDGAKIGVHSWAGDGVENAALLAKDDKSHQPYIDYYKEMAMPDPEGFYFFTVNAAEASGMYYMTSEELSQYGLVTE